MNKNYFLGACIFLSACFTKLNAQCGLTVTTTDSVLCIGDTTVLTAIVPEKTPLQTTLSAGNDHRGNMFDITAINNITIASFDAHPISNTTIEIYYKTGTYVGSENNPGAWTFIGSAAVTAQPFGSPTPVPVPVNIAIPAGQTYAFYVTSNNTSVSLNYTDGSGVGNVYASNADFQFKEGAGMEYPFTANTGSIFTPRVWNGVIHYFVTPTYQWSNGDTTMSTQVVPGTSTTYSVDVTIPGCAQTFSDSQLVQVIGSAINLGPDQNLCASDTIVLDAGTGFDAYTWSTTETTQSIELTTADLALGVNTISVEASEQGCTSTDTIQLTLNPSPQPDLGADQSGCDNGTIVLDAGAGFSSYAWSTGDTTQTYTVNASTVGVGTHTYTVTVENAQGCPGTDTVQVQIFGCSGVEGEDALSVLIYPNPSTDFVYITSNLQVTQTASVAVYNNVGQEVNIYSNIHTLDQLTLPVYQLAPGIYVVKIRVDGREYTGKIIRS